MKLEFNPDKAYINVVNKKFLTFEDYLSQPIVRWLHEHVGPISWPKDVNEVLQGEGWEIYADWTGWLAKVDKPRVYAIIHRPVDDRLITEFWMRFQ